MLLRQQLLLLQQPFVCALARLIEPLQFIAELLYHAQLYNAFPIAYEPRVAFAYRAAIILHDLPEIAARAHMLHSIVCVRAPDGADAITDAENQGRAFWHGNRVPCEADDRPTPLRETVYYVDDNARARAAPEGDPSTHGACFHDQ